MPRWCFALRLQSVFAHSFERGIQGTQYAVFVIERYDISIDSIPNQMNRGVHVLARDDGQSLAQGFVDYVPVDVFFRKGDEGVRRPEITK